MAADGIGSFLENDGDLTSFGFAGVTSIIFLVSSGSLIFLTITSYLYILVVDYPAELASSPSGPVFFSSNFPSFRLRRGLEALERMAAGFGAIEGCGAAGFSIGGLKAASTTYGISCLRLAEPVRLADGCLLGADGLLLGAAVGLGSTDAKVLSPYDS